MKGQWTLILALVFALIVAVFAVINVNTVEVHYMFGTASWPLILVILSSAIMGAIAAFAAGIFRFMHVQKQLKHLQKENESLRNQNIVEESNKKDQEQENTHF
ncbi:LapA family protein [Bacillus sp. DJP31]|uniref:LapA family protein n=1 Tax=Bacillus sp. DJP31 TaxID=3409789 RepID=UPI003BB5E740